MPRTQDTIGSRIRALRDAKGLSQEALAQQLGVRLNTVGRWERDEVIISADNLVKLVDYFEVEPETLGLALPAITAVRQAHAPTWYQQDAEQTREALEHIRSRVGDIPEIVDRLVAIGDQLARIESRLNGPTPAAQHA